MKNFLTLILVCCVAVFSALGQEGNLQDWTDSTGQFTTVAEFVSLDADEVILKKEDGTIVKIPISKLSNEHANLARKLASPPAQEPAAPELAPAGPEMAEVPDKAEEEIDAFDEGEIPPTPLGVLKDYSDAEDVMIQERLDSMDTPGKTGAWPFVRFFYGSIGLESKTVIQFSEDGVASYPTGKGGGELLPDKWKLDFIAPLFFVFGFLAAFVCSIWLIIVMFRESFWWGISQFLPCVSGIVCLLFLIQYWHEAKRPFLWCVFFALVFMMSLVFTPSWACEYGVLELALERSTKN